MSTIKKLAKEFAALGYAPEAVLERYAYADVLSNTGQTRSVALAAFTQTPPSYRTAAFGVVESDSANVSTKLMECRALGAPAIFVVDNAQVELWQVRPDGSPRRLATTSADQLSELFANNKEFWNPQSIHRAKAISSPTERQLDFVDLGLMVAIEGEVHTKLDALLREALELTTDSRGRPAMDARVLFQAAFRFLAAKILADRGHQASAQWSVGSVDTVLRGIEVYYGLQPVQVTRAKDRALLDSVWTKLRAGINFRNISADDLAFVYENTFVTAEVRANLGTHSTPRQMAEHIVRSLELWRNPDETKVYEPFTGAGVFLVAALRQLRGSLPLDWSDQRRHKFLTQRLAGDELDAFACEVAKLSLILADYPNHNGWDVQQADLFIDDRLSKRIDGKTFVLCNPPFEDFDLDDRSAGPTRSTVSKPIAVLDAVLNARPAGLGFVLPPTFAIERRYSDIRQRLERDFTFVEVVEIPDDIFQASRTGATLLVARDRRETADRKIHLVSREVSLRDRLPFLKAGVLTRTREIERWVEHPPSGDLWVPALHELWLQLRGNPKLREKVTMHRGIEWSIEQGNAVSDRQQKGFKRGLHTCKHRLQYAEQQLQWLDCRQDHSRGGALSLPWRQPKIILNAARLSRYQWRLAATFDSAGLVCSQQFMGLWPRTQMSRPEFFQLCAVLNGPIANAFSAVFTSPGSRFRVATLGEIPLPVAFRPTVAPLVKKYIESVNDRQALNSNAEHLQDLLIAIDAELLHSYDLPTRLERELLEYFEGARRPVAHPWQGWADLASTPGLRLSEIRAGLVSRLSGNWIEDVFGALPEDEAETLREYVG